jgi:hypothetical protein
LIRTSIGHAEHLAGEIFARRGASVGLDLSRARQDRFSADFFFAPRGHVANRVQLLADGVVFLIQGVIFRHHGSSAISRMAKSAIDSMAFFAAAMHSPTSMLSQTALLPLRPNAADHLISATFGQCGRVGVTTSRLPVRLTDALEANR